MGIWANFGRQDDVPDSDKQHEGKFSVAMDVLTKFGMPVKTGVTAGGPLANVDIKHMDALTAIKVSILETFASTKERNMTEVAVNADGYVYFYGVGASSAKLTDQYHSIQSGTVKEKIAGVLITGQDPLPQRRMKAWTDILNGGESFSVEDMTDNCNAANFGRYATIMYPDPLLKSSYSDGLNNLYSVSNPFTTVIGYAYRRSAPGFDDRTQLIHNANTKIPVKVSDGYMGTLVTPPTYSVSGLLDPSCWTGITQSVSGGIKVPIPSGLTYTVHGGKKINAFQGVVGVFFIGVRLDGIRTVPTSDADVSGTAGTVWVHANDGAYVSYTLQEGKDYVVNYTGATSASLVFANNKHPQDTGRYGSNVSFRPYPLSALSTGTGIPAAQNGNIFLFSHNQGMLVREIWAVIDAEIPSITVYHPDGRGNKAKSILDGMSYEIAAITITDNPPSMSFNGVTVSQVQGIKDNNPLTQSQSLTTGFEAVMDVMHEGGSGLTLTMSSLGQDAIDRLSAKLYTIISSGTGTATNYVCGPNSAPVLGGTGPAGGIVNEIVYNYSDQGSYTISVTEGSKYMGNLTQISGGPSLKQVETVGVKGTVIQDSGNHVNFQVRLDGMGTRTAINCQKDVIRIGDRVNCTIHNNPVEA